MLLNFLDQLFQVFEEVTFFGLQFWKRCKELLDL